MAIIVNTNLTALKTQSNLNKATNTMNATLNRMSTGYKINQAKDDAAGMYIANGIETQIRGSKVAKANIATGNNVLQIVEGDLNNMLEHLNRIRDLATQAANSVYDTETMNAMKLEVDARIAEIERISKLSQFNGLKLLDGSGDLDTAGMRLQIGANADASANSITISSTVFAKTDASTLGANGTNTPNAGSSITAADTVKTGAAKAFVAATAAASYISTLSNAINTISLRKSEIGATMARLETAEAGLVTTIENNTAAKSTIMDADIAEESMNFTKQQILQQTSAALLVQANQLPSIALNLIQ